MVKRDVIARAVDVVTLLRAFFDATSSTSLRPATPIWFRIVAQTVHEYITTGCTNNGDVLGAKTNGLQSRAHGMDRLRDDGPRSKERQNHGDCRMLKTYHGAMLGVDALARFSSRMATSNLLTKASNTWCTWKRSHSTGQ